MSRPRAKGSSASKQRRAHNLWTLYAFSKRRFYETPMPNAQRESQRLVPSLPQEEVSPVKCRELLSCFDRRDETKCVRRQPIYVPIFL
ncbi:uncharacterized protein PHALS_11805 [Plasmopara halstedii]|uniref:Uncharacterized protein n=1 Tax=Plasmopara halstedii TaxID=4781 RepID=A0A0P1AL80_PLAHL|nr:uncharacterized protein PHALS_11805 [Plasmopara halstedii]CEG41460.1 hypothetical protein PHALS_11805 [Plasmopara halstedii]|eukprot:XP_024577829.1 hypothetical protein PHALS_11805 [Plasmopara halstedii]